MKRDTAVTRVLDAIGDHIDARIDSDHDRVLKTGEELEQALHELADAIEEDSQ
jgi:hypothetical protein